MNSVLNSVVNILMMRTLSIQEDNSDSWPRNKCESPRHSFDLMDTWELYQPGWPQFDLKGNKEALFCPEMVRQDLKFCELLYRLLPLLSSLLNTYEPRGNNPFLGTVTFNDQPAFLKHVCQREVMLKESEMFWICFCGDLSAILGACGMCLGNVKSTQHLDYQLIVKHFLQ